MFKKVLPDFSFIFGMLALLTICFSSIEIKYMNRNDGLKEIGANLT